MMIMILMVIDVNMELIFSVTAKMEHHMNITLRPPMVACHLRGFTTQQGWQQHMSADNVFSTSVCCMLEFLPHVFRKFT